MRVVCSEEAQKRLTVRAGHVVVDARQQRRVAADVVARLALGEAAAHHHVDDRAASLELRVALDQRLQRHRRQVVGADRFQRPLDRPPDGRADGIDDHCFGHLGLSLLGRWTAPARGHPRRASAAVGAQGSVRDPLSESRRQTPSSSKPTWWASSWRTVRVDLVAQQVGVVAEVAAQRVAEDHDPVVGVVAGGAVALVEAVGAGARARRRRSPRRRGRARCAAGRAGRRARRGRAPRSPRRRAGRAP